ncbi:hypothetical protein K456DRAFT_42046 [Colletotrichum gloeosporioides 23]|nr:hypothetical protein K456DRAFT_42046 [Colletotrichum gloeosporioides 23]
MCQSHVLIHTSRKKAKVKRRLVSSWNIVDPDLCAHLVELFCRRSSSLLGLIVPADALIETICAGTCTRSLLLAVCAYSVRFSVHKAVKEPSASRLAKKFEQSARHQVDLSSAPGSEPSTVSTYCVLIEYSISLGDGRQAWMDLGKYLETLGCPTWNDQSNQQPNDGASSNQFFTQLLELLHLFIRIHRYCSSGFSKQNPPPWGLHSIFRTYQVELEQLVLQRLERLHPGSSEDDYLPQEQRTQSAMCSLIWHCCVICLNRNFLPIPKRTRPDHEDTEPSSRQLNFPAAPQLFVEERLNRCQASAVAICTICKELVWQGDFFRTAIVLANYLHRAPRPHTPWIADTLKFLFVALGAASSFYTPANDWIKVLIRVHDINVPLKHVSGSPVEDVFSTYFSRYVDIKEPEWVPLIPSSVSNAQGRVREDVSSGQGNHQSHSDKAQIEPGHGSQCKENWLHSYARHLSEDIEPHRQESTRSDTDDGDALEFHGGKNTGDPFGLVGGSLESSEAILPSMSQTSMMSQNMDAGKGSLVDPIGLADSLTDPFAFADLSGYQEDFDSRLLRQLMTGSDSLWAEMNIGLSCGKNPFM